MKGRPPVPFPLKVLRGNPGQRPIRPVLQVEPLREMPEPPMPLVAGYAADLWHDLELVALGVLTTLDLGPFSALCCSYRRWREASEALARMPQSEQLVSGGRVNPLLRVVRQAASDMVRFGNEFGIGPVARSRLSASARPGGKFNGLIGGGD